jgi:hypothetical protein
MSTLEKLTHASLIAVSGVCIYILITQHIVGSRPAGRPVQTGADFVGKQIELRGLGSSPRADVVVFMSTACRYCQESVPLYQKLSRGFQAARGRVRFVVVSPEEVDTTRRFLAEQNIAADAVLDIQPRSVGVLGTPTVLLVNSSHTVLSGYVGKLPPGREKELLGSIRRLCPECEL